MKWKRFAKTCAFTKEENANISQSIQVRNKVQKAIIFENDINERFLLLIKQQTDYEIYKMVGSNNILQMQGNILDIIEQIDEEYKYKKNKDMNNNNNNNNNNNDNNNNNIYLIEYMKQFTIVVVDDNYIHEIDILKKNRLRSIPFPLSTSMSVTHSSLLTTKSEYERYQLERKMIIQASVRLIPLNYDSIAILQSRFQNYSFSQISIYDSATALVFRQTIVGYRDQFDRGLFCAVYMNRINQIYFVQQCILDEPIKMLSLSLLDILEIDKIKVGEIDKLKQEYTEYNEQQVQNELTNCKQRNNKQVMREITTNKKYNNQIIDIRSIDDCQLVIFMNSNDRDISYDPCYLIYDTDHSLFFQEITFDNFESPVLLSQILSLNQINQSAILQFISSTGIHTIEYDFQLKQISTLQHQKSSNKPQIISYDFGSNPIQNTLTSESSYYTLNSKQNKIYKHYSVGLPHSVYFLLQEKGITDYLTQISLYDVFQFLQLIHTSSD